MCIQKLIYIAEDINVVNVRTRRKVREHVMFMTTNSDVSATAHQIAELCERRGERAYRPNQANGFNDTDRIPLYKMSQLAVC